jgi:PIN domain nuclease of toxin-antitoxin system
MKLLVDTHIILWWLADDPRLSKKADDYLFDAANDIYVSAVTSWEIAIKSSKGKLKVNLDEIHAALATNNFFTLAFTQQHATLVSKLPDYHGDPFDKALVAQSLAEGFHLLTHDSILSNYGEHVILV